MQSAKDPAATHRRTFGFFGVSLAVVLCSCAGAQSALDPRGPVANALAQTWWVMFAGATIIFAAVMLLALYAVLRAPAKRRQIDGNLLVVAGGVVFPVVTLTALLVYAVHTSGRLHAEHTGALRIEVIGHQWWWEVRYRDDPDVVTANEIHIPVGEPVLIELRSADVIHSFWVPRLAGKLDALPEQRNRLWLQADHPGIFRGQCAEFCGAQHARMGKLVVAQPRAEFEAWLAEQRRPARTPTTTAQARGREAFVRLGCSDCHAIRGMDTGVRLQPAPDLPHVGARQSPAAATRGNATEHLKAWITDPQAIKPGNRMPAFTAIDAVVLDDVVTYLASLK